MASRAGPILILGAGINGAAIARELALNGCDVVVVDRADIASGATAYSSRLIHGGLRYLEHGEFSLVRESLAERARLLRLAPHAVRPLRLFIPLKNRWGGLGATLSRVLRVPRRSSAAAQSPSAQARGLFLVRTGLALYDLYARDPTLPRHAVVRDNTAYPPVAPAYRWMCAYSDAQVLFPERLVVEMLVDGCEVAEQAKTQFDVLPYHEATLDGKIARVVSRTGADGVDFTFEPSAIVNATGAWVDETLGRLKLADRRRMGGTKGSHFIAFHPGLRAALDGRGIYAEADDGRPVFVLPLAEGVLVGTTDEPYEGDPAKARATDAELDYLLRTLNALVPSVPLTRADIDFHYSGVRPLPFVASNSPASITRRHWMERHASGPVLMYSVIGGKLTTARSLAEEAAHEILKDLGLSNVANSRERPLPGSRNYPSDAAGIEAELTWLCSTAGWSREEARAAWRILGTQAREVAEIARDQAGVIAGTQLPKAVVRWVINREWVTQLNDLVERRLMLLYDHPLSRAALEDVASLLVEAGRLIAEQVPTEVDRTIEHLAERYGKRVY